MTLRDHEWEYDKEGDLENIFTDDIYNDLGFIKGDKLMVLVEAQSTWTANIIIRAVWSSFDQEKS